MVDKLIDLLCLPLAVVVCRGQNDAERVIEILSHLEFTVEFRAPDVHRALRYTYHILLRIALAGSQQKGRQAHHAHLLYSGKKLVSCSHIY